MFEFWKETCPFIIRNEGSSATTLQETYDMQVLGFDSAKKSSKVQDVAPLVKTAQRKNDKLQGMFVTIKADTSGVKLLGKANNFLKKENEVVVSRVVVLPKAKVLSEPESKGSFTNVASTYTFSQQPCIVEVSDEKKLGAKLNQLGFYADTKGNVVKRHSWAQTDINSTRSFGVNTEDTLLNELIDRKLALLKPKKSYRDAEVQVDSLTCNEESVGPVVDLVMDDPQLDLAMNAVLAENAFKALFFIDLQNCGKLNENGNLPVHEAVLDNNLKHVIRQCTAMKIRNIDINTHNNSLQTPLQLALISNACIDIVDIFATKYHSDLEVIDYDGNNVLHLAVLYSEAEIVDLLASLTTSTIHNGTNFDGYTPLILSVISGDFEKTEALLKAHVDPNIGDKKSGRTALFHAVENNDITLVSLLLQYNAQTKVKNFFGTSPHDAMFELDAIDKNIKQLILTHRNPKMKYRKRKGELMQNYLTYQSAPTKKIKKSASPENQL